MELQKVKKGEDNGDENDVLIGVWFGYLKFFMGENK
jgi:hypothetical protein